MSKDNSKKLIVVIGPTASGKSELAAKLGRKINGEVISADSRQVYKGLDIGSGKVTKKEMLGITHHLLDVASPRHEFTAADFRKLGSKAIDDIVKRDKTPIIAGGTAFYINSLLYKADWANVPPDKKLRLKLEKDSAENLWKQLKKLDPRRAKNIDPKNKRRLIRALEIIIKTGNQVPRQQPGPQAPRYPGMEIIKLGIKPEPEVLKARIHERLLKRLRRGMIKEVKDLHAKGLSWKRLDELGLEYRYVSRHLRGLITKEEMIRLIERDSWRFANRQMRWWKKDDQIIWVKSSQEGLRLLAPAQKAP